MQYTLPEIEPLVTWDDVENHPDYQGLPPDKQMNVKKGWFKKTVESSDEWESKDVFKQNLARQNFFLPNTIPTPQKEALVKKYPEQWAAFMVGGGAAKLPGAATVDDWHRRRPWGGGRVAHRRAAHEFQPGVRDLRGSRAGPGQPRHAAFRADGRAVCVRGACRDWLRGGGPGHRAHPRAAISGERFRCGRRNRDHRWA